MTFAEKALRAWIEYDAARDQYEFDKNSWDNALTAKSANHIRISALLTRYRYEEALKVLRSLGYDPCGPNPVSESYFKEEKE